MSRLPLFAALICFIGCSAAEQAKSKKGAEKQYGVVLPAVGGTTAPAFSNMSAEELEAIGGPEEKPAKSSEKPVEPKAKSDPIVARDGPILVPLRGVKIVKMSKSQPIASAKTDKENIVSLFPTDEAAIAVKGNVPGTVRLTLTDQEGKVESFEVRVGPRFSVAVDETEIGQMVAQKPIKQVSNGNDKVIRVEKAAGAPENVKVSGLVRGEAHFTLIAEDGTSETHEVIVRSSKEPGDFLLLSVNQNGTIGSPVTVKGDQRRAPRLSKVVVDVEGIVSIEPLVSDQSKVIVSARAPGICWIVLTNDDRETTRYLVVVRERK
jgi:hypothetical protein